MHLPNPDQNGARKEHRDLRHWLTVLTVFGITGLSSLLFSRLLFDVILGWDGSLWSGPWSYRIAYLVVMPPVYSATLVLVGTLFGKRDYFARRVMRLWGRFIPKKIRGLNTETFEASTQRRADP